MLALITAALQGLAAIPKLIDQMREIWGEYQAMKVREYKARLDEVITRLDTDDSSETKKEVARELQQLIRNL